MIIKVLEDGAKGLLLLELEDLLGLLVEIDLKLTGRATIGLCKMSGGADDEGRTKM